MEANLSTSPKKPLLSVIIPAYNERDTIASTIARVRQAQVSKEIVVVDDASTDGTLEILEGLAGPDLTVLQQPRNLGKGAAIRAAIPHIKGEIAIIQDADAEYDPAEYPRLIAPITSGEAQVVYGSRFLTEGRSLRWPEGMRLANWLMNRLLALMANLLYGARITDEATCYKVFRADILKSLPLECRRFEFCPEITAKLRRRDIPIVEVPISYQARSTVQGKKINWKDGIQAIWTLLRYRFGE
ncbi:MAG: glycosyltransferase [Armatimonadetes bacterium]|nr:glycosyltransferase [Armatimonadota bacterium]NIM22998.1 glycosyltransferase [Armatimonadota bacterium]NIM66869.1 glycosyltransferase [Armatimonadota bacterium]NIM75409.1 glycosyltransferase [Armatimonadota bacterium]NIN05056.1 glycosyltransferase [Armatimonadota bacterium]